MQISKKNLRQQVVPDSQSIPHHRWLTYSQDIWHDSAPLCLESKRKAYNHRENSSIRAPGRAHPRVVAANVPPHRGLCCHGTIYWIRKYIQNYFLCFVEHKIKIILFTLKLIMVLF